MSDEKPVPTVESVLESIPHENLDELCTDFLDACRTSNKKRIETSLQSLRSSILQQGITESPEEKEEAIATNDNSSAGSLTLRGKIWKAMLGVSKVDSEAYLQLVSRGE